jgi:hypothetical protein
MKGIKLGSHLNVFKDFLYCQRHKLVLKQWLKCYYNHSLSLSYTHSLVKLFILLEDLIIVSKHAVVVSGF